MIPVSEVFGPTIQGEGPAAGRAASFVRLGGCNLSCSWCDSAYTWDGGRFDLREQITPMSVTQILDALPFAPITVLTGGEPLLHQRNPDWWSLMTELVKRSRLHVETNGTIEPFQITLSAASLIVVSPKQSHAGPHRGQQDPAMHPSWPTVEQAVVKVVVKDPAGVDFAAEAMSLAGWRNDQVWVMPEGIDPVVLAARWPGIAQRAADLGINASHRLHVLAWHDKRGH